MKRILGSIAAGIGLTGTLLSVLIGWQCWRLTKQWSLQVPEALGHLETMMASIQEQGEASETLLANARERLDTVDATVAELSEQAGQGPSTTTILRGMDREVVLRLQLAEEFLISMRTSLRNISNALLFVDSMPLLSRRLSPAGQDDQQQRQLVEVAATLSETAVMLDEAAETLIRIRSGQALPPGQLDQLRTILNRIDVGLAEVETEVRLFSVSLEQTQARIQHFRRSVGARLRTLAAALTALLVCFAATQVNLTVQGIALVMKRRRPQEP